VQFFLCPDKVDWFCIEGSGPKPDNFVVLSYFSLSIC
jgi:hypothetical protein